MEKTDNKTLAHIAVKQVCEVLGGVTTTQVWSKERTFKVATARQLVYWHLYYYGLSISDIARAMDKHHATIMYGIRQIEIMLERNKTKEDKRIYNAAEELKTLKDNSYGSGNKDNRNEDESVQ